MSRSNRALAAAQRGLAAAKRKPTDGDRPSPSTFPGRQPVLLEGQIALGEEIAEPPTEPADNEAEATEPFDDDIPF